MGGHLNIVIRGTGASVPDHVITNDHFASYLDTSDEWILSRTGIKERRKIADDKTVLDLALEASRLALEDAKMTPDELDLIMVCTATPETQVPATACWLQHELGISGENGIGTFDLSAACSGFIYGLVFASNIIQGGNYKNVLVVGAETLSRITDSQDRSTAILFGDGAGAAIISRSEDPEQGILYNELGADGSRAKAIWMPAGGSRDPASIRTVNERLHNLRMNGREVYKFAVLKMQQLIVEALERTGHVADDLAMIIPHQSNRRIMDSARERVNLPPEKMAVNIDRYGNTSSASVIMAFDEARRDGRLKAGDLVLIVAFGAGVTWGSALIRL